MHNFVCNLCKTLLTVTRTPVQPDTLKHVDGRASTITKSIAYNNFKCFHLNRARWHATCTSLLVHFVDLSDL